MPTGEDHATPAQGPTVDDAAAAFESLLSAEEAEEQQEREAPPRKAKAPVEEPEDEVPAESEDDEQPEQLEPEEPSDDEEESVEEPSQPRKFKVKANDQELEVTEDELLKGYSRTADYTRKTQQLATEKRDFEEKELQPVRAERQRYATALAKLEEIVTASAPAEPDWDTLRRGDPAEYAAAHADWERQQRQLEAVKTERAKADEKVRQDAETAYRAHIAQEQEKLLEAIPAWKDVAVRKTESKELSDYAQSLGYTADEIAQVVDHRLIKILRDAVQGRKKVAAKPAAQEIVRQKIETAKEVTPGPSARMKPKATELTRRKQALAKTGSVRDAAAVFEEWLD